MKGELFIRYYNVSPNSISRVQGPGRPRLLGSHFSGRW